VGFSFLYIFKVVLRWQITHSHNKLCALTTTACLAFVALGAFAQGAAVGAEKVCTRALESQNNQSDQSDQGDLKREIAQLRNEIEQLRVSQGDRWLNTQRIEHVRAVVNDVLSDAQTRSSLQTSAATGGYNDGFFISSPDGNFRLQVNAHLQTRFSYNWLSSRDMNNSTIGSATPPQTFNQAGVAKTAHGFAVRRARIFFSGHIVDPSWQYFLSFAYQQAFGRNRENADPRTASGGGVNQGDQGAGFVNMENAAIQKDFGNGFSLRIGQMKSPMLREWIISSMNLLTVERSLVHALFSTGWTQGIQANWRGENVRLTANFNDGANNANLGSISGTNVIAAQNSGAGFTQWAFTGRAEFMPLGDWEIFDQMTSMPREGTGILLGAAMNWQRGGQQGNTSNENIPTNGDADGMFLTWTTDATWSLGGANVYAAWVMNSSYSLPGGQGNINSYGVVLQGGYFVTDKIELFSRWEWMDIANTNTNLAGNNVSNNTSNSASVNNIATIGANCYLARGIKFSSDFGVSFGPVTFQNGIFGQNIVGADYRTEGASGGGQLVFRSQLQLIF